jgi:hypothetical protein
VKDRSHTVVLTPPIKVNYDLALYLMYKVVGGYLEIFQDIGGQYKNINTLRYKPTLSDE